MCTLINHFQFIWKPNQIDEIKNWRLHTAIRHEHKKYITHYWSHRGKANVNFGIKILYFQIFPLQSLSDRSLSQLFRRIRKIAKSNCKCYLFHVCQSARPSVWNNSAPTERIFMNFTRVLHENLSRKFLNFIKIQNNNWYITWRPQHNYDKILPNSWKC